MNELLALLVTLALQHGAMPPGMTHEQHHEHMAKDAALEKRGALAMGFDQHKTTHRFLTGANGGSIEVEVNDPADSTSREQVRSHLAEIAAAFAKGDFEKPFQTHAEIPPGVPALQRLKSAIRYKYEQTDRGGAVRITTSDPEALSAIHEFLHYQTREHHSDHPAAVKK